MLYKQRKRATNANANSFTMNTGRNTPPRNPLFLILALFSLCAVVGLAAWTASWSPVLSLNILPTPTHSQPFAFAKIAKPIVVNTSLPTDISPIAPVANDPQMPAPSLPTADPNLVTNPTEIQIVTSDPVIQPTDSVILPTDTQIPESMVQAQIVADSPVPDDYGGIPVTSGQDAPAPTNYSGNKYILVDISEQHMYVYEGDTLVYSFVSSTGMNNATRTGYFSVLDKIPNAYGATWNIWMPNWLGIYWAGSTENGIHALPILPNGATLWAGYLGTPISYGCVVLGTYEAQLLYDWADVGTPVEIRW